MVEMKVESYAGVILRDKRQRPLGIMVAMGTHPLDVDHPIHVILPIFVDQVSAEIQQERTEKVLRAQARELEQRNNELSRINMVMAHHFQEPSRRLVTFADQLKRGSGSGSGSGGDSRRAVEFIERQALHLNRLVRDIQRYLQVGAGVAPMERVDSRAVLDRVMSRMTTAVEQAGADVSSSAHLPIIRFWDEYLEMVFAILLENALTYRRNNRPLRVEIEAETAGGRTIFRCSDNGRGIAHGYRKNVLELFSHLGGNQPDSPGTGVGLAIVRKAVGLGGGSVVIKDGIDGGVTVEFDLPLAHQAMELIEDKSA